MTDPQLSYNKLLLFIDGCETYFDFKCCTLMVELFSKFYPNEKEKKQMLIDLQADKYWDVNKKETH